MAKAGKVTGYYARQAIGKAGLLIKDVQKDVVGFALKAGLGDRDGLEADGRGIMGKLQRIDALHRAALEGEFDGLPEEDRPEMEKAKVKS